MDDQFRAEAAKVLHAQMTQALGDALEARGIVTLRSSNDQSTSMEAYLALNLADVAFQVIDKASDPSFIDLVWDRLNAAGASGV